MAKGSKRKLDHPIPPSKSKRNKKKEGPTPILSTSRQGPKHPTPKSPTPSVEFNSDVDTGPAERMYVHC